jgi:hypothetical protein
MSVIVVVLSTSFIMGVNIGGPNLYNGVCSLVLPSNDILYFFSL